MSIWINILLTVISIVGIVSTLILAVKLAKEKALRKADTSIFLEQAEMVKSVIDTAVDGIITINDRALIESWNPSARKIFGYAAEEVIGKNVNILMPEPFHSQHDSYVSRYLQTGQARIIGLGREVIGKKKDGSVFPMDLAVGEFRIGKRHFFTGLVRDITERKKIESDLLAAKDAAESANLAKSSFLANVSHEIRTPLGAVMGFAELICDPLINPTDRTAYVAAIKRNGELLTNIINDILDLSKIEARKMLLNFRESSLKEVLTNVRTLFEAQANEKGLNLLFSCEENIPDIIRTDQLRLLQVLFNIVGNAIKFTSQGAVEISIKRVAATNGKNLLAFVVKDSGKGIEKDQMAKLFSPFSQVDMSSKRKYGGAGLGLVLAKRFANLLGGDVSLTATEINKGSTFTITIDPGPAYGSYAKTPEDKTTSPLGQIKLRLDGVRVLLADDSMDNQFLVRHILQMAGATVDTASNGLEALEKAQAGHYGVVLMDLQMPVMDGYEATAELRKGGYTGKIIALTAHALIEEKERCLKHGFDDHVSKPVDRNTLIERVGLLIGMKGPHREVDDLEDLLG